MFGFKNSLVQTVIIIAWILDSYTFGSVFLNNILVFSLCANVFLSVLMYDYDYWANKGVFSPPALPIVGHIGSVVAGKEQGGVCFQRIYNAYKDKKFFGIHQFYRRTLVVCDPELVRRVCVNDFMHFTDRGFFFDKKLDPLAESVLYLRGNEWKRLRAKISPIFSPIKLKGMLPLIENTANEFVLRVKKLVSESNESNKHTEVKNNRNEECSRVKANDINKNNLQEEVNNNNQYDSEIRKEDSVNVDNIKKQFHNIVIIKSNNLGTEELNNIKENYKEDSYAQNKSNQTYNRDNNNGLNQEETYYVKNNKNGGCCKNKPSKSSKVDQSIENNNIECSRVVDSDELVGGYTADAIVPCAFGVKSHVMDNPEDPFAVALRAFYELTFANIFEKTMRHLWPAFVLFFKMRIIPKKTHDFFYNIVCNVIKERQNGAQEKRGDFIDMMMSLQGEDKSIADKENDFMITDMIIAANAFIIFLGGYETTSSTLAFLFLELAAHPEVQEKMREEIIQVLEKHGGRMSSEALQDLSYMDMVIQETLRLYPPFPTIQRMCTRDYTIPGTSVVVQSGTIVVFPTMGLQRDELYFENASSFAPERWRSTNAPPPPGVYAPFGDGPRYCIGKRFAIIQMKTCLVKLLPHLRISPAFDKVRTQPFAVDLRTPMTLHPADSRVRISLL